jgi:uridine kinase
MTSKIESIERLGLVWIGIQGGTCAGKSTLAGKLFTRLGAENTAIICLDSFFKPYDRKANAGNVTAYNFDHPSSLDWDALEAAARAISSGEPIRVAEFDYEPDSFSKGK